MHREVAGLSRLMVLMMLRWLRERVPEGNQSLTSHFRKEVVSPKK